VAYNYLTDLNQEQRRGGIPLPNIGSMDGNTGRSEGATAAKNNDVGGFHSRILDRWTATQAAPKAPQRKRPCRSRALSLILTVVELRVREPRQGLVAFRHLGTVCWTFLWPR
jgi:hypothetical protein